ncbi:barstar family protein [Actinosynnema sp. NPDC059335]|uniref:barstar family protein n=1 Tax=Actinosynnema sp. NPDC059335 TaxID=3346804 RepID=UPI00366FBE55
MLTWLRPLGMSLTSRPASEPEMSSAMDVELDGSRILSSADLHDEIATILDLGPYYGRNLDALWDRISADVARPVRLKWINARVSREALGAEEFSKVVDVLRRAAEQDRQAGLIERFEFDVFD